VVELSTLLEMTGDRTREPPITLPGGKGEPDRESQTAGCGVCKCLETPQGGNCVPTPNILHAYLASCEPLKAERPTRWISR
jgi:hypothetical protein